ncbi:MAG: response regulator [Deltaproteobacteria bacterium]|nr:response regulator [Deltaproteobacteria bacterium]
MDDSRTICEALRSMLQPEGYNVIVARSVTEARERIADHQPDLIFIDRHLQAEEDGFEVARIARQELPHVARLMMTGDHSLETAIRAMEEDIFGYLTKPLQKPAVLLKVRRALDRAMLRREREEALKSLEEANVALAQRAAQLEDTLGHLVETQSQLAESEKLASLGALAAGVAHEVNNPTMFITPNLDYLLRTIETMAELGRQAGADAVVLEREREHGRRMLDRCREGVARIAEVVRMLQLFSRGAQGHHTTFELGELCCSLVNLVRHDLDGVATLAVHIEPGLWIEGSQPELAQAVLNLLLNARRSITEASVSEPKIEFSLKGDQASAVITVSDNGVPARPTGDGEAELDPFDEAGIAKSGLGLTLSVVRDIAERHGGRLQALHRERQNLLQLHVPVVAGAAHVDP